MPNPTVNVADRYVDALPVPFKRYRALVNAALRESLQDRDIPVYDMLRYAMGWSDVDGNSRTATEGKALRPTLCLLACEATGGRASEALPAAVALELIHNFSLVHDDIQDRDETRHHRPTLWAVWGDAKALVAGNTFRAVADKALWSLVDEGVSYDDSLEVVRLLTEACLEMIEGQCLDLMYEGRLDIGPPEYMDMISLKTGALIRCALNVGAVIGTSDEDTVRAFRDCGRSLGFVFQIRDDVLGVWGDEEITGKPVGADIRRKKNSMPVVFTMSQARGGDRDLLADIYTRETLSDDDVAQVLDVMERVGTRSYAQDLAKKYRDRALASLSVAELPPRAHREMEEIAGFLLERQR